MEEPEIEKSEHRQHRDWLHSKHGKEMAMLKEVIGVLKKMEVFFMTKKKFAF